MNIPSIINPDAEIDKIADETSKAALDAYTKLYGPQFCKHCNQVQPIQTFELEGSKTTEVSEDHIITFGFTGTQVCTVCHKAAER